MAIAVPIITVRQEIFGDKNFRGFSVIPYDHESLFPEIYFLKAI